MTGPFSLEGKRILITGSSSGIGRGIAIECSRQGAVLILNGRNQDRLEETMSLLEGDEHSILIGDLGSQAIIEEISAQIPVLDGAVFCAGIPQVSPVRHFKRGDIEKILGINTVAPMMMTSALLKKKKIRRGSSLVFVESISGVFVGTRGDVAYNASKAGLNGFVKGAALELAPMGIRLNAINPGLVPTAILELSDSKVGEGHHLEIVKDSYPLKRLGTPQDIAFGAIYLLSDASSWVTGINLVIDGGYLLN